MVTKLFDKKGKKLAAIMYFNRNYGVRKKNSKQIFTISFSYRDLPEKYICCLLQLLSRGISSTAGLEWQ